MDNSNYSIKIRAMLNKALICFALCASSQVLASTVTIPANNTATTFAQGTDGNPDILVSAYKNDNNISFNNLNSLVINTAPLQIYNGVRKSDDNTNNDIAKTIVISASTINLSNKIEIIGAPADLLLISSSANPITCNQCSFVNAGRVTIANATYTDASIGELNILEGRTINVNGLTAPGIQSLEFLAHNINLAGTIDTNLKADIHPAGGMIITEDGSKVVGSGGVNIYSGNYAINYQDLALSPPRLATGSFSFSGKINAATIAVTSPSTITIPQHSQLNTANDALSSSTRNGAFYAPLEGIFLSTIGSNANIDIQGTLLTDYSLSLKSNKDLTISNSGKVIAPNTEFIARDLINNYGLLQTTNFTAAANSYRNTGTLSSNIATIDVLSNIYNSYGGKITANRITLKSHQGTIINGSRTNKIDYDLSKSLTPSLDVTTLTWGIKEDITQTGSLSSNLSAHILASDIYIEAQKFENINPYFLTKPTSSSWDSGIAINNTQANQVSVQAENNLQIKTSQYILNASAILGVNQEGTLAFNTPLFSNERYYLAADTFRFSQLNLSSDTSRYHNKVETGNTTKITAYSPPGRLYSFGNFRFNNLSTLTAKSEFINEFSYFEVFQNSYFHNSDIKTIGLEVGLSTNVTTFQAIRSCIVYQRCLAGSIMTTAEAETLFSIQGNLYGIDPSAQSESDLTVGNINVLEVEIQNAIKDYLAQFYTGTNQPVENNAYTYPINSMVNNDTLTADIYTCTFRRILADGGYLDEFCTKRVITKSITELLNERTGDQEFEGSGYTYSQLEAAFTAYIKTRPPISRRVYKVTSRTTNLTGFSYNVTNQTFTVLYSETTKFLEEVDDGKYVPLTEILRPTIYVSKTTIKPYIK